MPPARTLGKLSCFLQVFKLNVTFFKKVCLTSLTMFPLLLPNFLEYFASFALSQCFLGGSVVKNPPAAAGDARDACSIPGCGRSLGGGNGTPVQYSLLNTEEPGSLQGSQSDMTEHTHTHTLCILLKI